MLLYRSPPPKKLSWIRILSDMPLVDITLSHELFESVREKILREVSGLVASTLGKSEASVQILLSDAHALFGGEPGPSAFVEVRSVDSLDANTTSRLARQMCDLLQDEADVPAERVYLNFMEVARGDWGWNGKLLP